MRKTEDLIIFFTGYVHIKSIKNLSQHYHELIGKMKEHEGKIFDS